MKYTPVIGLEVHVELNTKSKMFCKCSTLYFGEKPNTHTCPICLGLPGALPYPNDKAIKNCIMIGLSLNCQIADHSYFDRKNYFYPDLPKGYQISQYKDPFCQNGYLDINVNGKTKRIKIRRVHMEEDTGKIVHTKVNGENVSLLDFNRSGIPLVEIVTEPDIETGIEAKIFLTQLQKIIRYLGVSDADMEKGDMRLEPNISLKQEGTEELPSYKVEVKNINSFRFAEKAINYEIERQKKLLDKGEKPPQETRGWDDIKSKTMSQRIKEEAHDYRYFPEPDIPPISYTQEEISKIKDRVPELPQQKIVRFQTEYGLLNYDAEILTREKETADYLEKAIKLGKEHNITPKQIANAIINRKIYEEKTLPEELIKSIILSTQTASIDEKKLEDIIKKVLEENPKAVQDYKKGKENVIMFLVGQAMRNFKEKIDANIVRKKIGEELKK